MCICVWDCRVQTSRYRCTYIHEGIPAREPTEPGLRLGVWNRDPAAIHDPRAIGIRGSELLCKGAGKYGEKPTENNIRPHWYLFCVWNHYSVRAVARKSRGRPERGFQIPHTPLASPHPFRLLRSLASQPLTQPPQLARILASAPPTCQPWKLNHMELG